MANPQVRLGILGLGTVGQALVALIDEQHGTILERTGIDLIVTKVAVRDVNKPRGVDLAAGSLTTDGMEVVESEYVDVVVELVGGIQPTKSYVERALELGKPVVTANKELLAAHGAELFTAAADGIETSLLFEAAVAGGIPLMRALEQSLRGEPLQRVMGIVNGTTNYILSQMSDHGASYADALAEAQRLGFAEADPTADVDGHDAAAKAAIIATVGFGGSVTSSQVAVEGISNITADDIEAARSMGYAIKLLAIVEHVGQPGDLEVAVRVHPAMVPLNHPLASVRDSFNAVFIEGGAVGELMLYGRGAGGRPTGSAVLGDVIEAAVAVVSGRAHARPSVAPARVRPLADLRSAFYVEVKVTDQPGVLATVAGVFGSNNVSIKSMEQRGSNADARLLFITHEASEGDLAATLAKLAELEDVHDVGISLRVIGS